MFDDPCDPWDGSESLAPSADQKPWGPVARFWHWSSRWPWYSALFLGALGVIAVNEFGFGMALLILSGLSFTSKLAHWNGIRERPKYTILLKALGGVGIVLMLTICLSTVAALKGDRPWSNAPKAWNDFADTHWRPIAEPPRSKPARPPLDAYRFSPKPQRQPSAEQVELARREKLLSELRQEYILTHDRLSASLLAGTEQPPGDWVNDRLKERGERWSVTTPAPQQLAQLQFSFWTPSEEPFPLMMESLRPGEGGAVIVEFFIKNVSTAVAARSADLWIIICNGCKYATEPNGFMKREGTADAVRHLVFPSLNAGVRIERNSFKVIPPPGVAAFEVAFRYECETCGGVHDAQRATVFMLPPLQVKEPKQISR